MYVAQPIEWTDRGVVMLDQRRLPDDEYWAAKQVMAFTEADIRTIVETGKYSDAAAVDYIVSTLMARRDKIVEQFQKLIADKGENEVLY